MTAAHHLRVHSPVKSIDHWPICVSEERELLLELSRLKIVFPLWWARAVMYPICVTLKTLNLKLKMSDRGCRRWWQLSINRANPSRRTSRNFFQQQLGDEEDPADCGCEIEDDWCYLRPWSASFSFVQFYISHLFVWQLPDSAHLLWRPNLFARFSYV